MQRKQNTVLEGQARQMVYSVYCFFKNNPHLGIGKNMLEIYKNTAEATSTSVATVRRIIKEANNSGFPIVFRTPGKKRSRKHPVTGSIDQRAIKRCIHNYHLTNKDKLTVEKLRQKLREEINFQGSDRSLRRIIKMLGFKWKKTENNRKILICDDEPEIKSEEQENDDVKYNDQMASTSMITVEVPGLEGSFMGKE